MKLIKRGIVTAVQRHSEKSQLNHFVLKQHLIRSAVMDIYQMHTIAADCSVSMVWRDERHSRTKLDECDRHRVISGLAVTVV
jgi:hypothetical protein